MEARVTAQSQPFRLMERMEEANIVHGEQVRADLPHVRVTALAASAGGQALFCHLGPIRIREVLHPGDGCLVPTDVTLRGLGVPRAGTYDICNVLVSSNGDLELIVDEKTWLVPVVNESGLDGSYTFS